MPTEKPRVTFTISQERLSEVDTYRFENKIKNQTQAILSLIDKGLSGISKSTEKTPPYSDEAMKLAEDYDGLDGHGKRVVRLLTDEEKVRCEADRQARAAALRKSREQMEVVEEIVPPDAAEMLVYINPAAAGTPLYAESDFERLTFPAGKVPRGADFGIRISGRSMEPTVMDGSIVWVRKRLEIPNGTVGVFMLNDSAVCKRFFKGNDGAIWLESDNPEFESVTVTEFDTFVLVGEVIGTI